MSTDKHRSKRRLPFPFNLLLVPVALVALLIALQITVARFHFEHAQSQLLVAQDSAAIRKVLGTPDAVYLTAHEARDALSNFTFRRLPDGNEELRYDDLPEVDGQLHCYKTSFFPPRGDYIVYFVDGEIVDIYEIMTSIGVARR